MVDEDGHGFWAVPPAACHYFENVGAFLVTAGREIVVDAAPDADPSLVRISVLGPALGLLLHQRGHLVLHASAVSSKGRAVAFLGARGFGKSTLATLLHARGWGVISDDVTAVDMSGEAPLVLAGYPQVKLWPDVVYAVGASPEALPRLHPLFDKRALPVERGYTRQSLPLERVYVLSAGDEAAVEPLSPVEAVVSIIPHWYGVRFGEPFLRSGDVAALHLEQCGRLATHVEMRRLVRPRVTWSAETLADLVEADLST